MGFFLCHGCQNRQDHASVTVQGVDIVRFKFHPYRRVKIFQRFDNRKAVNDISGKTGDGLCKDQVNLSRLTILDQLLHSFAVCQRRLPVLSVVDDGVLRGYVPFDKDWTGFSAEEYREASESVMREKQSNTVEVRKRLDLTGYEVVRAQYFATLQNPAMTISNGRLRFNAACLKKFDDVEYVELLLNSVDRCIAIRPCEKSNPNAIRWGRLKEGRWCASTLGCRGLAKALFDIMEWDEDLKYRFRGQLVEQGGDKLMLFELDEPEMIKVEEIVLPPKEEESEGETVKKTIYIFPPEWAGTFGQPITSVAQIGILQQEHYAGNWDVLRPASEIKEMNIFTADGLNTLLHEAEEIMEGWIDIDGGKQNVNAAEGAGIGD